MNIFLLFLLLFVVVADGGWYEDDTNTNAKEINQFPLNWN